MRWIESQSSGLGAVGSFTGYVRNDCLNDVDLTSMELEHYEGMTEKSIQKIAQEAALRFNLAALTVIHRFGRLVPGDRIVLVLAAASHRKQALGAVDFMMDHLKSTVPFWKRETHGARQTWVEAKTSDAHALAQWSRSV